MGIPGFYGRFVNENAQEEAVTSTPPPYVASLTLDYNSIKHDVLKSMPTTASRNPALNKGYENYTAAEYESSYFINLETYLLNIFGLIKPRDAVLFAFDGVVPKAKIQQQKGRRERTADEAGTNPIFDKNAITTGTEFMARSVAWIYRFIDKNQSSFPFKMLILSSYLNAGEGEHKIFDYFRSGVLTSGTAAKDGAAHVVYGLDADLIMLSLISNIDRIYLYRQSVTDIINIDGLKKFLINRTQKPTAVEDFVIMMFLIGNDFLPHSPALEGMHQSVNTLLDIYSEGDYSFSTKDEQGLFDINWSQLSNFIQKLAEKESSLLQRKSTIGIKHPSKILLESVRQGMFYPSIYRNLWYTNAFKPRGNQELITDVLNIVNNYNISPNDIGTNSNRIYEEFPAGTDEQITQMVIDYLRTFNWIYLYYNHGNSAVNQDWSYNYHYTPLLSDVALVLQKIDSTEFANGYKAHPNMLKISTLHQMIATIPLKSRQLIPYEYQQLYDEDSVLRDTYYTKFEIDNDGKNSDYEGVVLIPFVNLQRIVDVVDSIPVKSNGRWDEKEDEKFVFIGKDLPLEYRAQLIDDMKIFLLTKSVPMKHKKQRYGSKHRQEKNKQYKANLQGAPQTGPVTILQNPNRLSQPIQPRNPKNPNQQNPNYIPNQQNPNYVPNQQNPNYVAKQQNPNYVPKQQNPNYVPKQQNPNYVPKQQNANYVPKQQNANYVPNQQKANYVPQQNANYIPQQKANYVPKQQNANYIPQQQQQKASYIPKPQTSNSQPSQPLLSRVNNIALQTRTFPDNWTSEDLM